MSYTEARRSGLQESSRMCLSIINPTPVLFSHRADQQQLNTALTQFSTCAPEFTLPQLKVSVLMGPLGVSAGEHKAHCRTE